MTVSIPLHSRFKYTERPFMAPGKCAVCGAVDRPVVEFGLNIDFYGVPYFCVQCLEELAVIIGMVPSDLVTAVEEGSRQSVDAYLTAHNKVAISRELYDSLVNNLDGLYNLRSDLRSDLVLQAPVVDSEDAPRESLGESGDDSEPDGSTGPSDNIPVGEGSTSISASGSDEDGTLFDLR